MLTQAKLFKQLRKLADQRRRNDRARAMRRLDAIIEAREALIYARHAQKRLHRLVVNDAMRLAASR